MFTINKINFDEIFESLALEQRYFNDCARVCDEMHDRIVTNNNYSYVCKENKKIIGILKAEISGYKEITIVVLVVKKEFRRKGLGKLLLKRLLEDTKHYKIFLYVSVKNEIAMSFYTKEGFKRVEIKTNFFKDKTNAFLMAKEN